MTDDIVLGPDLRRLEAVIEQGMRTFVDVGRALLEIREKRMYRDHRYSSFDEYCRERWGWNRAHAYRLIEAASVVDAVSPIGDTAPANEGQARELARAEDPVEVWAEVVDTYEPADITAAVIRDHVEQRVRVETHEPPPRIQVLVDPVVEPLWSREFRDVIRRALTLGALADDLRGVLDEEMLVAS